jgi:diacylglycerol kinase family enzyme
VKVIIAAAILLASAAAHGQVMKCVSPDGRIEYANRCPAGTSEHQTTISTKTSSGPRASSSAKAPAASAEKSLAERNAEFNKRQLEQREEQQKAQKLAAEKAQKTQACNDARNYLRTLESGVQLRGVDPKTGEVGYFDDARRAAEEAKARSAVSQNCN